MLETSRYARKPFYIDAVQVTAENINDVGKWCQGEVRTDAEKAQYVKVRVHRPLNERQTKAYAGDWILFAGTGYKVYTAKAFSASFELAPPETVISETAPPILEESADETKRKAS